MKTKKLVSAFVAVAAFVNIVSAAHLYAEEAVIPESFIRTNDDADFPLHLDFDIDKSSIEYIKLDEPLYGNEYALNPEKLSFDLLVSLKEEYKDFDSFELTVADADNNDTVLSDTSDKDSIISIPDLAVKDTYSFDLKLYIGEDVCGYVGSLTVYIEIDNCLSIDVFYQNSFNECGIMTYTEPWSEGESNNTESLSTGLPDGISVYGTLSSTSDIDYYQISAPAKSKYSTISLDIALSAPSSTKMKMTVRATDGSYTKTLTSSSTGKGIYLRIPNIKLSTKFYIKVECDNSTWSSGKYYITANRHEGFTWFSQFNATGGYNCDYWNPNMMDTVKLSYGGTTKPIFINNSDNSHWFKEGCVITSIAMILNSKGKTMEGYDLRTNYTGQMLADPYIVMLANCKLNGTSIKSANQVINVSIYPVSIQSYSDIGDRFGTSCKFDSINITEEKIQSNIDKYGHCLVYFNNNMNSTTPPHCMVFTDYDKTASKFADRYTVYDPAATSLSKGAGVKLSQTSEKYSNMQLSNISLIGSYY